MSPIVASVKVNFLSYRYRANSIENSIESSIEAEIITFLPKKAAI